MHHWDSKGGKEKNGNSAPRGTARQRYNHDTKGKESFVVFFDLSEHTWNGSSW